MSIILLRGFSRSGKDFVGQILCDKYGYKRFAFADSLKKIVADEYDCDIDLLHSQIGKLQICENDLLKRTYRQILIDEALRYRNIDPGVFAKHCCKKIYGANPEEIPDKIVITDWRYQNEYDIIQENFPNHIIIPVNVQRLGQIESPINDISEYQLINRPDDYILVNNLDNTIHDEVNNLIIYIDSI